MKLVPIKDVITEKISGEWGSEAIDGKGVVVIRTANFLNSGKINFSNLARREVDNKKVTKKRLLSGDIIIEKSGGSPTQPVGRVVLFRSPDNDTYLCNNFTSILRPNKNEVHPEYLFYVLHNNHKKGKTLRHQNKTTGIINLKLDSYLDSEIPLPSLDDQIRIAHLLGKVEGLIAQRKQHLQQLDDLLKSVFLEMFGFRDQSYTQWTIDKLTAHTEIVSGVTKGKKYKLVELIEVPYMRVANVQDGHLVLDEIKTISVSQKEIDQYQLQHGDLLLTEGGDPDKLGRGFVWEGQIETCIHQNHIFRVRVKKRAEINPYYLSALVGSGYGKAFFLKSAKQTTGIASINSTQLKNFPAVIPPINLQNKFVAIVEKVESVKSKYLQSLTDLENLYGALSQKAFKGELNLSRVPLPAVKEGQAETTNLEPIQADAPELIINLTGISALLDAVQGPMRQQDILKCWLDAHRSQLGDMPFLVQHFMEAAQTGLAELHPDNDFELVANDYEHIKTWVFEALTDGTLSQVFDDEHNHVTLKSRYADWGSW